MTLRVHLGSSAASSTRGTGDTGGTEPGVGYRFVPLTGASRP